MVTWSLYTAPDDQITTDLLREFVSEQYEARLLTESMTLELKEQRRGDNIAKAVAGFANADGGIILLGISEDAASLDDARGVPPSEVVAIGDSCRNLLTPLVKPSIVPVPLPGRDEVVIVVRVDPDVSLQPVCKAGTVYVRAPGQTVPASREQIIALASRSQSAPLNAAQAMSLQSIYVPQLVAPPRTFDALIRVAGGVWLRPSASEFVFNTANRASLLASLERSPFVLLPAQRFQWRRRENRPQLVEASFTSSSVKYLVEYPEDDVVYRVFVQFRRDGDRISYALDLEFRVRPEANPDPEPRLGREELAAALQAGVQTVAISLPETLATTAGSAPRRIEPVLWWAQNPTRSFDQLLDLSRTSRTSSEPFGTQWGKEAPAPRTEEEVSEVVRTTLEHLYLDLGLLDAESLADEDLRRGLALLANIQREVLF